MDALKPQNTEQRLAMLEKEIEQLKRQNTIDRFLPVEQQDAIAEIIKDRINDIVWEDILYVTYITNQTASSNSTLGNTGISFVSAPLFTDKVIRHDRTTRFKASVSIGTNTNARFYVTTIDDTYVFGDKKSAVGFKLQSNVIYGVSHAQGEESSVVIGEYEQNVGNILELRYFPRERVDFYINGEYRGSLSDNLPNTTSEGLSVIDYCTVTSETVSSNNGGTIDVGYFEFMQKRT